MHNGFHKLFSIFLRGLQARVITHNVALPLNEPLQGLDKLQASYEFTNYLSCLWYPPRPDSFVTILLMQNLTFAELKWYPHTGIICGIWKVGGPEPPTTSTTSAQVNLPLEVLPGFEVGRFTGLPMFAVHYADRICARCSIVLHRSNGNLFWQCCKIPYGSTYKV